MSKFGDTIENRKALQRALNVYRATVPLPPIDVDGIWGGKQTAPAIVQFRTAMNLPAVSGKGFVPEVDGPLLDRLGLGIAPVTQPGTLANGVLNLLIGLALSTIMKDFKMDNTKVWYGSTAIWGAGLALVGSALGYFHVGFNAADQATVVSSIIQVGTGVSAIVAIIGRILADSKIVFFK